MKTLTNSTMNPAMENAQTLPHQMAFTNFTSNSAAPFLHLLPDASAAVASDHADRSEPSKARSEAVRFGLAVIAVIGAATLWGWALMQLCGLFLHAESLLLRNTLPL
jgi:hypothetical protein